MRAGVGPVAPPGWTILNQRTDAGGRSSSAQTSTRSVDVVAWALNLDFYC